jgi:hypothetical protein
MGKLNKSITLHLFFQIRYLVDIIFYVLKENKYIDLYIYRYFYLYISYNYYFSFEFSFHSNI